MRHANAWFSVTSIALLGLALGACQDDASKLAGHMERGQQYVEEGKLREAVIEFRSALQIDPNYAPAHYELAHAYLRSSKPREGFWELRETVRLDPSHTDAKLEFSQIAIVAGEAEEALKQVDSIIQADPTHVPAHLLRGHALDVLKRHDEAADAFRAGLEADPTDEAALRNLARVERRSGNREAARVLFEKLIEHHPSYSSYGVYAGFLGEAGDAAGREAALKKALELAEGEERPRAYASLTSFYVRSQRQDEALQMLEQAIEAEPEPAEVIYLLARLHRSLGDNERADALIAEAAARQPDDPRVHLVLSAYRARQGDLEGALESATRATELEPEDRRARLQRAEVLMEIGFRQDDPEARAESRRILDEILADEASSPEALLADGKYKLSANDHDAAIAQLRAALDARPNWAQAHYLLGLALASKEDFSAARAELGRALEIDSSQLDAKGVLARVHYQLGEWEYCVERAESYLVERPGDTSVLLIMAQSLVRLGRLDEAEKQLRKVPEEERDAEVLFALARIEQAKGNVDVARGMLLEANAQLPRHWDILSALLVIDRSQGRLPESKERIMAALEEDPENARLQQLAGLVAFNEEDNEEAEARFRKAIELDPGDLAAYERLARFYAKTGRLEQTAGVYEEALAAHPENARFHHFLAVIYELSGERERAIARYEDAIRYGPHLAEAKNNLAYLYADSNKNLDRALDLAQDAKELLPDNPSVADTLGWVLYKRGVPSAAISYLKEAEATTEPGDASMGVVRFHLAQAYEANGESEAALAAVERSLQALEEQMADSSPDHEPEWAPEARQLRDRLVAAQTAAS